MTARRGMGELEAEVMGQLWGAGRPLTPSEVRARVAGGLAYTTVMTILGRLWDKGLAQRERQGRAYVYWPSVTDAELTAQRMRSVLDRTKDRESSLAHFVDDLPPKDERALRRILGQLSAEG